MEKFALYGFLAPVILFFQQSRNFLLSIFRLVWKRRDVHCYPNHFYSVVYKNSWLVPLDNYIIDWSYLGVKKENRYRDIMGKKYHFQIFLWKRFIPVFLYGTEDGFSINYLAFTFPFEKVVVQSHRETIQSLSTGRSFYVEEKRGTSLKTIEGARDVNSGSPTSNNASSQQRKPPIVGLSYAIANHQTELFGYKCSEVVATLPRGTNDKYVFTEVGQEVLAEVKKWLDSRDWFESRNIPWRRGILLHSKPGYGKSSLITEIAKELQLPLIIFDIATMDNREFVKNIESLPSECIVLFEDFERVFEGDKNIQKSNDFGGLTFDCLLNKLSGANPMRKVFVFITANDITKVDHALIRPGRMDRVIELPPMSLEEKRKVANVILKDKPELIDKVLKEGEPLTNAEFENLCIQNALDIFWNERR
jgi:hypothetical protein